LEVGVLAYLRNRLLIGQLKSLLDNERSKGHSHGIGVVARYTELPAVTFFDNIPRYQTGKSYPSVFTIERGPEGLLEFKEPKFRLQRFLPVRIHILSTVSDEKSTLSIDKNLRKYIFGNLLCQSLS
jgi:hypothetical protein